MRAICQDLTEDLLSLNLFGNSWIKIKTLLKDTIVWSFLKCGISNRLYRSEENLINIRFIEDYEMPGPRKMFHPLSVRREPNQQPFFWRLQNGITKKEISSPER